MSQITPLLATLVAGGLLLLLPGALLMLLVGPVLTLVEFLALAAAASWCIIAVVGVVAFAVGATVLQSVMAITGVAITLGAARVWRRGRWPWPHLDAPSLALLIAISVLSLLAFRVGGYADVEHGPVVSSDFNAAQDLTQIAEVRRIADAPSLHFAAGAADIRAPGSTLIPMHPFALALFSEIARVDPLIGFDTFRLWSAALSLLALCSLAVGVLGTAAGTLTAAAAMGLVFVGYLGQVPGVHGWGQLLPLSLAGDFSSGLLVPLTLGLLARVVRDPDEGAWSTGLSAVMLAALILIDHREALRMVGYIGGALGVGVATTSLSARQCDRLGRLLAIVLATGLVARLWLSPVSGGVGDAGPRSLALLTLTALLVAPFCLAWYRRVPAVAMVAAGLLASWGLPILLRNTASAAPPSAHVGLLVCAIGLILMMQLVASASGAVVLEAGSASAGDGRSWRIPLGPVAMMATVTVMALPWLLARIAGAVVFHSWWTAGAIGATSLLALMVVPGDRGPSTIRSVIPTHLLRTLGAVGLGCYLAWPAPSGLSLVALRLERPMHHSVELAQWYERAGLSRSLPWPVVEMLRTTIPPGSVVATDAELELAIPAVANQYVLPGAPRRLSVSSDDAPRDAAPTLDWIERGRPDYVLAAPGQSTPLAGLVDERADRFELMGAAEGFQLFRPRY